jgi:hypothetical protein
LLFLVNISQEIKISLICEKCELRISKSVMHMIDKPIKNLTLFS